MKTPDNFTLETDDPHAVFKATEKARQARGDDDYFVRTHVRIQAEYTFERVKIPEVVKDIVKRYQLGFLTSVEAVAQVVDRVSVDLLYASEVVDTFFPDRVGKPRLEIGRGVTDDVTVVIELPIDNGYDHKRLQELDRWICSDDETRYRRLRHVSFELRPCIPGEEKRR